MHFLQEDIGTGDITSNNVVPNHTVVHATVACTSPSSSITCGLEEAKTVFEMCGCNAQPATREGSAVRKGDIVMNIIGEARSVLKAERTALNLIMRMSGIATITREFVNLTHKCYPEVKIAGTRKTAPGLRYFDKKAISIGGGYSHRMRLDDMVLIKDNHLAAAESIERSIQTAKDNVGSAIRIECEVKSIEEAVRAAKAGADVVMLDNFSPSEAEKGVRAIRELHPCDEVEIELSGGINLGNVIDYAKAKPNIISVGYLTHSSKAIDYSLSILMKY
ncbi:MAG TPA: carboxylating nicotinate-nucleotide diphosphorylase [Nitrososphaeraceae archaeon]|nr:carboxylating nicotinate-nucleotide diphosphorylase [Nitrososphaeraceae archaeon]